MSIQSSNISLKAWFPSSASDEKNVGKLTASYYDSMQVEWEVPLLFSQDGIAHFNVSESPIFTFGENTWKLSLLEDLHRNALKVQIINVECLDNQLIKHKLGLKKVDGSVKYLPGIIFDKHFTSSGLVFQCAFIGRLELWHSRCELAPSNIVTFMCSLKRITSHSSQLSVIHEPSPVKLIQLNKLSENFRSLFADKDSSDVILQVKGIEFHVHKAILMARSSVFASMFHHDTSENQTGIITINDCDPNSFHEFLEFLYCGKLKDISFLNAFHLYNTSDKYNIQELKSFCNKYIAQCLTEANVCDVAVLADKCSDEMLLDAVQEFFNGNIRKIVVTTQWESLLKDNYLLANRLIIGISSKVQIED